MLFFLFRVEKLYLSVIEDSVVNSCIVLYFLMFYNKFCFIVVFVYNGNFVVFDFFYRKVV